MSSTTVGESPFTPALPGLVNPVSSAEALQQVVLSEPVRQQIDAQLADYLHGLLNDDVMGDPFRRKLHSAFSLGKEELSRAAALMTGRYMERNLVGVKGSAFVEALGAMRTVFGKLNPAVHGELQSGGKFLGLFSFGNKLKDYFATYQSGSAELNSAVASLCKARDDLQKDADQIEQLRKRLWAAMLRLRGAIYFAERVEQEILSRLDALRRSDARRADRLQSDVLSPVRQNQEDMLTQISVNMNGYLCMEALRRIADELVKCCDQVTTSSLTALLTARNVGSATGSALPSIDALGALHPAVAQGVASLSPIVGKALGGAEAISANPQQGIEQMKGVFGLAVSQLDGVEQYRAQAAELIGKNNQMIKEHLALSIPYLERTRSLTITTPDDDTNFLVKL